MWDHGSIWKNMGVAALAAGIVTGATVSASAPAMAAIADCPKGSACAWADAGWSGTYVKFRSQIKNFETYKMHDKTTSVYNNGRTHAARYYKDENYRGKSFTLARGEKDGNLKNSVGVVGGGFNDSVDSAKFV